MTVREIFYKLKFSNFILNIRKLDVFGKFLRILYSVSVGSYIVAPASGGNDCLGLKTTRVSLKYEALYLNNINLPIIVTLVDSAYHYEEKVHIFH